MHSICEGNRTLIEKTERDFKREVLIQAADMNEKVCSSKKRGRKPLNRGKMLIPGPKGKVPSFWDRRNAIQDAIDDSEFPDAQPGGNYDKAKQFLKKEWKHVEEFKLPDLSKALGEKYPEHADYNGFRLQRWHDAAYWETGGVATKPLYKKATYRTYFNIFYVEPE
jgi:hypothetical protein